MTLSYFGVCRSFALMVSHGLCSSGLFCLSNISYERFGRRGLLVNKGLINLIPRMPIPRSTILKDKTRHFVISHTPYTNHCL